MDVKQCCVLPLACIALCNSSAPTNSTCPISPLQMVATNRTATDDVQTYDKPKLQKAFHMLIYMLIKQEDAVTSLRECLRADEHHAGHVSADIRPPQLS